MPNNSNDTKMYKDVQRLCIHMQLILAWGSISGQNLELNIVECTGKGSSFWLSFRLSQGCLTARLYSLMLVSFEELVSLVA